MATTGTNASPRRGGLGFKLALVALLAIFGFVVVAARLSGSGGTDIGTSVGVAAAPRGTGAELHVQYPEGPALPIPEPLPADPHAPTPEVVLGRIEIPRIGLSADVQEGMTLTAIDRGPAWWPGTARPGGWGNVVIAGHRTIHSQPFNRLNELQPGDQVVFTTESGRFVYAVRGVLVVPENWIDIAAQDRAHTATLFACHPPGSATERIVAKLELLDDAGHPVDPDSALPPLDAEAGRTDHTLIVRDHSGEPGYDAGSATDPFAGTSG